MTAPAFEPELLVHSNNLAHKARLAAKLASPIPDLMAKAAGAYGEFISTIPWAQVAAGQFDEATALLGKYHDIAKAIERAHPFFNWRSDFASSIIPEFLYRITHVHLTAQGIAPFFSTKESIVELTVGRLEETSLNVRRKNQDFCLGFQRLSIKAGNHDLVFVRPELVCEIKTNIDINKLNGLDFSAERLKRTFPGAHYFLVTETIDFSLADNYAAGSIDEVYVLRKQLRSKARRRKETLKADVISVLLFDIVTLARKAARVYGHVYTRLEKGKLING